MKKAHPPGLSLRNCLAGYHLKFHVVQQPHHESPEILCDRTLYRNIHVYLYLRKSLVLVVAFEGFHHATVLGILFSSTICPIKGITNWI